MPINSDGIWIAGRPMWHGWTEGPYKGRPTFWGDYRYEDKHVVKGRWRHRYFTNESDDPMYYDASIADGTSKYGALQNDTRWTPAPSTWMGGRDHKRQTLPEWQDVLYKRSWQYQDIASKWKLSPEHPGIKYRMGASANHGFGEKWQFGVVGLAESWFSMRNLIPGPRFHDSPLGENIHEKPIVMVRLAALFAFPASAAMTWMYDGRLHNVNGEVARMMARNWWIAFRKPAAIGAVWATVMALSCRMRGGLDDGWNGLYASIAGGGMVRLMGGPTSPFRRSFMGLFVLTTTYTMLKSHDHGLGFADAYRMQYNYAAPHHLQTALFGAEASPAPPQLF